MATKSKMSTSISRVITTTTTKSASNQPANPRPSENEGGYIWGTHGKTWRKMTPAEQAIANREYDQVPEQRRYRKGRNVSVASNNLKLAGHYGIYGNWDDEPASSPNPPAKTTPPPKMEKVKVGDLKIKPTSGMQLKQKKAEIIKPKLTTEVPVAIEKPTKKPVPKRAKGGVVVSTVQKHRSLLGKKLFKTDTRTALKVKGVKKPVGVVAGDSSKKRAVKAENRKIGAAQRAFKREEKLATGYLKNQGIFEGENKREMKGAVKSYAKAKRMEPGIMDKTTRQAIKSGKTAARYLGKVEKGKVKSFTPEALAKRKTVSAKVQTKTTGKGKDKFTTKTIVPTKQSKRMQAGRYVY